MAEPQSFPYETRLNIYYQPLQVIEEKALADACMYKWYNQTLCQVNASVVRLGVVEGEYHWHKHDEDDEFFYVVEGQLQSIWRTAPLNLARDRVSLCRRESFTGQGRVSEQ